MYPNIHEPKFSITKQLKGTVRTLDKTVLFTISNATPNSLKSVWVHVTLPKQETNDPFKKIFYSEFATGLSILNNINILLNGVLVKTFTSQEYEFDLKMNLGIEKFKKLVKTYLNVQESVHYTNRKNNNQTHFIDQEVIHFPIFFHSNSNLVRSGKSITIEMSFLSLSKLFVYSKNFEIADLDLININSSAVYELSNDLEHFQVEWDNPYEKEFAYEIDVIKNDEYFIEKKCYFCNSR